ncbi:hypothetical protein HRG_007618 [Hirsutella rhossiliensis]|uniref:Uncharacterized protein n=1 Tax=Hirsutella rhossiliensis TaxID=111463 RepID=A0A9P8MUM9_9HYPO|nr:uncharacterized protein HRG_07618 [Hirsutella rhossiliensis]KAH0961540.1 hypothetical protein HRG_07618 [Hirsutella rhossiliensis]
MISGYMAYDIAAGALLLLTAAAAAIGFLCTLCMARRRKDAARSWLALYKLAFGFFILAVLLSFFSHLLAVVYTELYDAAFRARATSAVSDLFRAHLQTGIVGSLLYEFAFIFVLLALIGLAAGIRIVHGGAESTLERLMRAGFYVTALLLSILNIVGFALSERHFIMTYSNRDLLKDGVHVPRTARQALRATRVVTLIMLVVQLVATLVLLARSVLVAVQTRSELKVKTATRYLLVCCTLLLLKVSYDIAYYAKYVPFGDANSIMSDADSSRPGPHFAIIDIVLSCWPLFVLLVLLLVLATKKQHGLWSTEQPFMMVRPGGHGMPLQTPWGYGYSPQSQQPLHPSWEQPQGPQYHHAHPHERPLQQQSSPAPHFVQHDPSPQPHWQAAPFPHPQQPHDMGTQAGHFPSPSSPPPAHSDAMGLYHQADGTPPQMTPLPYNEKK